MLRYYQIRNNSGLISSSRPQVCVAVSDFIHHSKTIALKKRAIEVYKFNIIDTAEQQKEN